MKWRLRYWGAGVGTVPGICWVLLLMNFQYPSSKPFAFWLWTYFVICKLDREVSWKLAELTGSKCCDQQNKAHLEASSSVLVLELILSYIIFINESYNGIERTDQQVCRYCKTGRSGWNTRGLCYSKLLQPVGKMGQNLINFSKGKHWSESDPGVNPAETTKLLSVWSTGHIKRGFNSWAF